MHFKYKLMVTGFGAKIYLVSTTAHTTKHARLLNSYGKLQLNSPDLKLYWK